MVGDITSGFALVVKNGGNIFIIDISADGLVNNVTISGAKDVKWVDTKLSDVRIELKWLKVYLL